MNTIYEIVVPLVAVAFVAFIAFFIVRRMGPMLGKAKSETVDCVLYVLIGLFTAFQSAIGGEDTYKYVNPFVLYWLKVVTGSVLGAALAMKMYRSGRKPSPEQQAPIGPYEQTR